MEYRYSHLIDPTSYDNQGLCDGIPLRVHRNSDLGEVGTIRLRSDWQKFVGPIPPTSCGGNMGPIYNFASVCVPECRPDRLEIVSYIIEFGFLHDDLIDTSKITEVNGLNSQIMDGLSEGHDNGKVNVERPGEGRILHNLVEELMSIDPEKAKEMINYWRKDLEVDRDQTHFANFEEYLEYRIVDCGGLFMIALATFGMGIAIPSEEKDECFRLTRPVWAVAGLTNDLQSWNKEYELFRPEERADMSNAVWILMKQDCIDIEEARCRVVRKIQDFVSEYVETVKNIHTSRQDLSFNSRFFVETMQYMISGNLMWGISSPRYHPDRTLTDFQLALMKKGYTEKLTTSTSQRIDAKVNGTDDSHRESSTENGLTNGSHNDIVNGSKDHEVDLTEGVNPLLAQDLPPLTRTIIHSPAHYIESLPAKGVRNKLADALNVWLRVPENDFNRIKNIIHVLHNASLMLDDVEDGSISRRGAPATHTVFGVAQTINSAGHQIIEALKEVRRLNSTHCLEIFIHEMDNLYVGQSHDLFWVCNIHCPTVEEYLKMIDNKTGGLFSLLSGFMVAKSTLHVKPDLSCLMTLLGRYFQVRDDYRNLTSVEYTKQKGFCEDLDEGKFSLILIHAMQFAPKEDALTLRNLLSQRHVTGGLSTSQKQIVLNIMNRVGSIDYTVAALEKLHAQMGKEFEKVENLCGIPNRPLLALINLLEV